MWNCRASAGYIAIPAQDRSEPVVANGSSRTSVESPDRGTGKDSINVATAGPAARVRCGKGNDVVRFNINARRRVKGCERRYSIR
jgi:hypothetical protein